MRTFATIAFSFAAGVFLAVLLPWGGWYLWAAGAAASLTAGWLLLGKGHRLAKRAILVCAALAGAFLYFYAYDLLICEPVRESCGEESTFRAVVADYPTPTEWGYKVTVYLRPGAKAVYYGAEDVGELLPGQRISGLARWQDASRIRETSITAFTARGVFVLLYQRGELDVEPGWYKSPLFLPQRLGRLVRQQIGRIWEDPVTESFMLAELTGDRGHMSEEDSAAMSQVGLAHLFAVSGLHCTFLVTLIGLLIPASRRRLYCAVSIAVLLFYMVMVGMSASVVRACIMQIALLVAPLFKRDSDSLTSLGGALMVLLLLNPYAAGGISLQLSFAATLGLLLVSGRIYAYLTGLYRGQRRPVKRLVSLVSANVSASLAALLFTVPLTAYYFNIVTLIAPLSNLLAVPLAGWNFMAGLLTVLLSFAWLPAAQTVGWSNWAMVHCVLWIARLLMRLPLHALYMNNRYLKYWLAYVYSMLGICLWMKGGRRRYVTALSLAAAMLLVVVTLNNRLYHYGTMNALAIDVGQGECMLLYSGDSAVLVDCGSSNSYISAGARAADQIGSMGIERLSAVVLTHYHADHANGMAELLARVPVERLWLPDIEDEFGVRDRLISMARRYGIEVVYVYEPSHLPMGAAELTVFPPIGAGDMNEQGLTILCSAEDFDLLITGDMAGSTEKQLIEMYDLPDVEVLVVSHHGSRYSSAMEFLETVRPETAVICVGENSYGHPAQEAMRRLDAAGAQIYRTDLQGNILITVHGGES